jgi:hypothetical protein
VQSLSHHHAHCHADFLLSPLREWTKRDLELLTPCGRHLQRHFGLSAAMANTVAEIHGLRRGSFRKTRENRVREANDEVDQRRRQRSLTYVKQARLLTMASVRPKIVAGGVRRPPATSPTNISQTTTDCRSRREKHGDAS